MRNIWIGLICLMLWVPMPVRGLEETAPPVPYEAADRMPEETGDFGKGSWQLLKKTVDSVLPEFRAGAASCGVILCTVLLFQIPGVWTDRVPGELAGVVSLSAMILGSARSLIGLAERTVVAMQEYGKLLLPVLTAALAAQGGVTGSAALYTGTTVFSSILASLITGVILPGVYLYLAASIAHGAMGEEIFLKCKELLKKFCTWMLKTLLTVFLGYMTITGAVSGSADGAALKWTKTAISAAVPMVGGVLSGASEAVLAGAAVVKSAAGIYGLLAIGAVFLRPFCRIGVQYLLLRITAAICGLFGSKRLCGLVDDHAAALGLLLAMTGTECLLLYISVICFLRGMG